MPQGEKNKLTDEDRATILSLKGIKSVASIAEDFGISNTMVYKIFDPVKYKSKHKPIKDITKMTPTELIRFVKVLAQFFTKPEVFDSIPLKEREQFMAKLSDKQEELLNNVL